MRNKDVGKLKEEMQAKELVKQAEQKRRGNCHEHAFFYIACMSVRSNCMLQRSLRMPKLRPQ
jgi:hypothetical protein